MSNATISEIYENARQRIVNSALGQALGMTSNTEILDAAIDVEGVEVCSDAQATTYNLDTTNSRVRFYLPKTGFWKNTNHIWQSYANLASILNVTSDKILSGNTLLGINGTGKTISELKVAGYGTTNQITFVSDCTVTITGSTNSGMYQTSRILHNSENIHNNSGGYWAGATVDLTRTIKAGDILKFESVYSEDARYRSSHSCTVTVLS